MTSSLDLALQQAQENFRRKRPKTEALHARARAVMPGGNTRTILYSAPFPIRIEKGEGQIIIDVDGHAYVDLVGEYSAGIYGHSHPRIRRAVEEALAMGLNIGAHHAREVAFAEAVTRRFGLDLVRFTNSGTEANMMALAAAQNFTKRRKIMPMFGGYHGGTLFFTAGAGPVNAPYEVVLGRFNDGVTTRKLIDQHADDLAAVIVEPMQGTSCLSADPAFLAMLREETAKRGVVLILDEVMTSRLSPGGLAPVMGVAPDLKTLGKYVGGGMSFGAFGGRADIMGQFDPARPDALPHAGTFNNNTLTMTAGFVAITEVYTAEAVNDLNGRGDRLRASLNDLFMRYQAPMQATGIGSMITLHPVVGEVRTPEDVQKADKRLRQLLFLDLLDDGFYIAERGFMALSLKVSEEDCARLVAAVERFIARRRELLTSMPD
jgi:glutamate-1-semialdehyde 2,1-aminomutase